MNTKQLIDDKMMFSEHSRVKVNALELIEMVVAYEKLQLAYHALTNKLISTEASRDVYKHRCSSDIYVDLRA